MTQMTQFCILTHSDVFCVADGWVIFFFTGKCGGFFSHTVDEGFFFSKNFHLLEVKMVHP